MTAALILNAREAILERAARAMCDRHCGQCGIADTEAYFARTRDDYIAEAAAVLDSVGAAELLWSLEEMCSVWRCVCGIHGWAPDHVGQYGKAMASAAKARGK